MKILSVRLVRAADDCPDTSHLGEYSNTPDESHIDRKARGDMRRGEFRYFNLGAGDSAYLEEDYRRMEAYNRGDWCMCGIYAEAKVEAGGTTQRVKSAGLWGIESDSGEAYFREVGAQELTDLADILRGMGASEEDISAAMSGELEIIDR